MGVRDYTPENTVDDWFADVYVAVAGQRAENGGANAFLAFLQGELHHAIARRYRLRDETAALFGDSYGGLFTYYAMLQMESLYDRFWIGSPGVFGKGTYLLDRLRPRLRSGFARPTRIALTLGSGERSMSVGGALREEIYREIAGSFDTIESVLSETAVPNLDLRRRNSRARATSA